ncbi:NfeD family protein [Bacillota bacterium LX-D]|nr:NfeD family protein [Bacillota bacterium LX-D]
MKKYFAVALLLLTVAAFSCSFALPQASAAGNKVYVVKVQGAIEGALAKHIAKAYKEAAANNAQRVLLEIDTLGGQVNAAIEIKDTIEQSPVETISFVTGRAISAGALIALAAPELVMAPGTTMGAAEPRVGEEKADEKFVSFWSGELAAAAEKNGRNPQIARSMADADIEIPGLVQKGKLLTLTDAQAQKWGMTNATLATRNDVLAKYNLQDAEIIEYTQSAGEKLARFLSSPYVSPLLLTIGIAGLIVEVFTIGFGIAGGVGLAALSLYFGASIIAGLTGWETILIFLVGLILMLVEVLLIPGHGFAGVLGFVAVLISIFQAAPSLEQASVSIVIALIGTILIAILSFKYLPTRNVWKKLMLETHQDKTAGYVNIKSSLEELIGQQGVAITPLRPAGSALFGERRVDVVTEGDFIAPKSTVKVLKVEGTKVVVAKVDAVTKD